MGQELFCYIVSVPREIGVNARTRAKERVRKLAALAKNEREKLCEADNAECDWEELTDDLQQLLQEENGWCVDGEGIVGCIDRLAGFTDADVDRIIDFLLDPASCWDTGWRDDLIEGRRVIVAGGATWGDAPDGPGYRNLIDIYRLGLEETLGIQ